MVVAVLESADPFARAADMLDPEPHPFVDDAAGWVGDRLGEFLTVDQRGICQSVVDHRYTAVKSCHDTGKSFTAARLAAWWLDTHPVGQAFVVTTAPTDPQVKVILWKEIKVAHTKGDLPGRVTEDAHWKINGLPVAYGRKPADYNQAAFQGVHARWVLVIIDEACGVVKSLYDAVDSLATNQNARVLAIGNPDDPSAHFATICKPGSGWNVLELDAFRSPNFNAEGIAPYPDVAALMAAEGIAPSTEYVPDDLRDLLVSPLWVHERIRRWGVGTPLWEAKVRGRFPKVSDDALFEPGWIVAAQNRELYPDPEDPGLGVDVARYGKDETTIYLRRLGHVRLVHSGRKDSTMVTAGWVIRHITEQPFRLVAYVDDVGVGGGVTDRIAEQGFEVVGLNGGWAATDPKMFGNARSEWYWALRMAFEAGEVDIDPLDEDLAAQLTAIKYKPDSRGRIWVESKEDMAKRGLPSPDRADGVCYAFVRMAPLAPMPADGAKDESLTGDLLTKEW